MLFSQDSSCSSTAFSSVTVVWNEALDVSTFVLSVCIAEVSLFFLFSLCKAGFLTLFLFFLTFHMFSLVGFKPA